MRAASFVLTEIYSFIACSEKSIDNWNNICCFF